MSSSAIPSFVPSTAPSANGTSSSNTTVDRLAAYRCLPRDELGFEWTAFLPPLVITLQLAWIFYLMSGRLTRKNVDADSTTHLQPPRTKQQANRIMIVSYLLTFLHIVITLLEVIMNQSRHTVHAVWVVPFAYLCIALSMVIFVKLFWVGRHFFIGIFLSYLPVSVGSFFLKWGIQCPDEQVHEDNCYVLYNDEVIWVTGLAVTLLSILTIGVYTLVISLACKCFCHYRTVHETPWVRYIERVEIGWSGYSHQIVLLCAGLDFGWRFP